MNELFRLIIKTIPPPEILERISILGGVWMPYSEHEEAEVHSMAGSCLTIFPFKFRACCSVPRKLTHRQNSRRPASGRGFLFWWAGRGPAELGMGGGYSMLEVYSQICPVG